jgi:hypothetical protein
MANEKNLKHFKKGEVANPTGRPRKLVSLLKEQGYKRSEVVDTMLAMLAMDIKELEEVADRTTSTVLEKMVASAIKKSNKKGDLSTLEILLNRAFGAPKQEIENTILSQKPILSVNPIIMKPENEQ